MGSEKSSRILLFPWLAHGHITPYLQLGRKLLARNFEVYLVSTPANFTSIKQKVPDSMRLVELHLPSLPELPPHLHTTKGLPPRLMPSLKRALHEASPAFLEILEIHRPDLVIYDFIQPWAPTMAASLGIPAVLFLSLSASAASLFMHSLFCSPGDGSAFPFPNIHYRDYELESMMKSASAEETDDKDRIKDCFSNSCDFILIRTFREIEGKYIDYLPRCIGKNILPLGPLIDCPPSDGGGRVDFCPLMQWLDEKAEGSTLYVSFGTEYYLSRGDMREISLGLELSGVNFIWVVRFPVGEEDGMDSLPDGFLERVSRRGTVVGWAPQNLVLAHPSITGFVSHCGWGSVIEAMEAGVPIIAMPMQIDQPLNTRLVAELGVGVEAIRDGSGELRGDEIAKVIRRVVQGETGAELKARAREIRDSMRHKGELYVDAAVKELCKLVRLSSPELQENNIN